MLGSTICMLTVVFHVFTGIPDWGRTQEAHSRLSSDKNLVLAASEASQGIAIRVQILPRAPDGGVITIQGSTSGEPTKSVAFKFLIEGAPSGKSYQFWFQDRGMKEDGLPPVPVPNSEIRYEVNEDGRLRVSGTNSSGYSPFAISAVNFARGEWIQFEIRSTDRTVSKKVRFTPYR